MFCPLCKFAHCAASWHIGRVTSLRERKRRATKKALAHAAFELALAHGVEGFTISDVVGRAGYSRRTFANYFSSKEAAITGLVFVRIEESLDAALTAPDLPLLDWIEQVVRRFLDADLIQLQHQLQALAEASPSLLPHIAAADQQMWQASMALISQHGHHDLSRMSTHLLVGAVWGALSVGLRTAPRLRPEAGQPEIDPAAIDEFIATVFGHLRDGF